MRRKENKKESAEEPDPGANTQCRVLKDRL